DPQGGAGHRPGPRVLAPAPVPDRAVPRGGFRMSAPLSNARAVGLVASREFVTQVQKKSFLISNAIILVAIVVGIVATSVLSGGDDDRPTVGVVGAPALQTTIESLGETVGT